MSKFKVEIIERPKYAFDPRTKQTKCIIKFDIRDLAVFIMKGPQAESTKKDGETVLVKPTVMCDYGKKDKNTALEDFAWTVKNCIAEHLITKGVIHQSPEGILYVEGIAKFNPEDPESDFDKQKGRDIAYAKAQIEILKVQHAILMDMEQLATRLLDCTNWMLWAMPNSLNQRITRAHDNLQRAIDRDINADK